MKEPATALFLMDQEEEEMNDKLIEWIRGLLVSSNAAIDRINNGTLSRKDQGNLIKMLGELQEELEKLPEFSRNPYIQEIGQNLTGLQEALGDKNTDEIKKKMGGVAKGLQEAEKITYIKEALQLDASTLSLEDEIKQRKEQIKDSFQKAVNIDIGTNGVISKILSESMQAFRFTIDENNQVVNEIIGKENNAAANDNRQFQEREEAYKGFAYTKGDGTKQQPATVYGSTLQGILTTLQGWNMGRTEDNKLFNVYIGRLNTNENKYENYVKYNIESGRDITPIYLNLPHLPSKKYKELTQEISRKGARFNSFKKKWFITKDHDINFFKDYLPINGSVERETDPSQTVKSMEYSISVGEEYYDNRATVYYGHEQSIDVYGDDYDVHFPSMSSPETKEIVEKFILPDLKPEIKRTKESITYDGKTYSEAQYAVIQRAVHDGLTQSQIKLIADPLLKPALMEELRFSIKDGLSEEQVAFIKDKCSELWQMDFMRIGLQHAIPTDKILPIIQDGNYNPERDWLSKRNELDQLKKEYQGSGSIHSLGQSEPTEQPLQTASVKQPSGVPAIYIGWKFNGGTVEANKVDNRLQIFFNDKPNKDTCTELKSKGFRWAPSIGAWQRQLNDNAIIATNRIQEIWPTTGEKPTELQMSVRQKVAKPSISGQLKAAQEQIQKDRGDSGVEGGKFPQKQLEAAK